MRWIEFIHLRTSPDDRDNVVEELRGPITSCAAVPGIESARLFAHANYPGDVATCLAWNNQRSPAKTREGLVLADLMARHGTVEHGVWLNVSDEPFFRTLEK